MVVEPLEENIDVGRYAYSRARRKTGMISEEKFPGFDGIVIGRQKVEGQLNLKIMVSRDLFRRDVNRPASLRASLPGALPGLILLTLAIGFHQIP